MNGMLTINECWFWALVIIAVIFPLQWKALFDYQKRLEKVEDYVGSTFMVIIGPMIIVFLSFFILFISEVALNFNFGGGIILPPLN